MIVRLFAVFVLCRVGVLSIRPKGVRAELATFYNPASDFSCLDGSGSLPFIQVNDDYCDCDDGSDEPGTAACPNGKFYCENKGHNPLVIPSSRVNDGICDCCDGSDEWDSNICADVCIELGREAREAAIAAAKVAAQGYSIKLGMIAEAQKLQDERSQDIITKEKEKDELEASMEQRKAAKEAAEAPEKEALEYYKQLEEEENRKKTELEQLARDVEAEELFASLDANNDGVIIVQELQVRRGLDTDKDGVVTIEEAQFFMSGNEEMDLETFKTVGFALLKPYLDLVEEVVAPPLPIDADDNEETPDLVQSPDQPEVYDPWRQNQAEAEQAEHGEDDFDEDDDEEPDMMDDEDEDDYDVSDLPDHDHLPEQDYQRNPRPVSVQQADRYDEKTRNLIAVADQARKEFDEVDRRIRDLDRDIGKLKEGIEKDYGFGGEFMVMAGQCFEYTDNEYTYKMCPFDMCSQRPKNGGSETRLGSWGNWEGSSDNKYSAMKFSGGQGCWNGPARSAKVHVHCGIDNTLSTVSEPNRCEYEMHFYTPAACHKPVGGHDEL